jgi:hypothetical protein
MMVHCEFTQYTFGCKTIPVDKKWVDAWAGTITATSAWDLENPASFRAEIELMA